MIYTVELSDEKKKSLETLGFNFRAITNPYRRGDKVKLLVDVKDEYQETWYSIGEIVTVMRLTSDEQGLMFSSDLGTHWTNVELVERVC
jgi:hypothetical protein